MGGADHVPGHVELAWLPSLHLEVSTKAAYRSKLDTHFLPFFGDYPLAAISPSMVQPWVIHGSKPAASSGRTQDPAE